MLDKLKNALAKYKSMGKVKKFFVTYVVAMIALVVLFFGGIFISAVVDVIKNPDAYETTTTTTKAITEALVTSFPSVTRGIDTMGRRRVLNGLKLIDDVY